MTTLNQFQGCLLGLALGDALGAPYEGGILERLVWRIIGKTTQGEMRWTDDTQMAVDMIETFLLKGCFDQDELARHFAASYRWSRGYGPGAARVLKKILRGAVWREANRSVYSDGSLGNGAAMRAPVVGLLRTNTLEKIAEIAAQTAVVTHAHPIGIQGAVLLAIATALVAQSKGPEEVLREAADYCDREEFRSRIEVAAGWLRSEKSASRSDVVNQLGRGIAANESCVTAVYLALRFLKLPFMEMQRFIADLGGDVDTIGAMSGAIWGTANGASVLPAEMLAKLEQKDRLQMLASDFQKKVAESER